VAHSALSIILAVEIRWPDALVGRRFQPYSRLTAIREFHTGGLEGLAQRGQRHFSKLLAALESRHGIWGRAGISC
jgi:hypothetical protein